MTTYTCATCELAAKVLDRYSFRRSNPALKADAAKYIDAQYSAALAHLDRCEWAPVAAPVAR